MMRKIFQHISLLPVLAMLVCIHTQAQPAFKTIVPQQPVVVGESFPVQYVLEDIEKTDDFTAPAFKGFRMAGGPNIYNGSAGRTGISKSLKNIVFTLVAVNPGKYIIAGATVKVNGRLIKSNYAVVNVISKAEAFERAMKEGTDETVSEYFLRPGEDPYEKMKKNLFMKVMVDKKSCYVGEPLVATFKLYSRLESRSDIVKNPGFYGFAVQDMIGLDDKLTTTETIYGRPFYVHTVRKVQLYPLQAGMFSIDPMEVVNKVEFSKSAVNKRPEQEIFEGVIENNEQRDKDNTVTYENSLSTEKIAIHVKPLPAHNKPTVFNGATGKFSIRASLEKNDIAKNEESSLIITITGKGNFTQLSPPAFQWPAGMESFEPEIKDSLDKTQTPLKGSRTFRFPFVAGNAGEYIVPAISFAFFDPDSNNYKTVSASPLAIRVSDKEKETVTAPSKPGAKIIHTKPGMLWWAGGSVLIILLVAFAWWMKKSRETKSEVSQTEEIAAVSVEEFLQPAWFVVTGNDNQFYTVLQKCMWNYLGTRFNLSGSAMNKRALYKAMQEKNLSPDKFQSILDILQHCETAVFTKAEFLHDKQELLNKARKAMEEIKVA
jgi:hypothetical protein